PIYQAHDGPFRWIGPALGERAHYAGGGLEPLVFDDADPRRGGVDDAGEEGLLIGQEALVEGVKRPALPVLVQTGGGEEEDGRGPGQVRVVDLEGIALGRADEAVIDQQIAEPVV